MMPALSRHEVVNVAALGLKGKQKQGEGGPVRPNMAAPPPPDANTEEGRAELIAKLDPDFHGLLQRKEVGAMPYKDCSVRQGAGR